MSEDINEGASLLEVLHDALYDPKGAYDDEGTTIADRLEALCVTQCEYLGSVLIFEHNGKTLSLTLKEMGAGDFHENYRDVTGLAMVDAAKGDGRIQ